MKEDEYKTRYATTEVFKENVENLPPIRSLEHHLSLNQVMQYPYVNFILYGAKGRQNKSAILH